MPATTSHRFSGAIAPQVAGLFYPDDAGTLSRLLDQVLTDARSRISASRAPKAVIVPHAGYSFSASVAASAYAHLEMGRDEIRRVVLLGPAHRHGFRGMALCSAAAFLTPLGMCPVDAETLESLVDLPGVRVLNEAFQNEHSLEVHLPFLQTVLGAIQIVPIIVGQSSAQDVARIVEYLWGGPETCLVISSDLSHFHPDHEARRIDAQTSTLIESGRQDQLTSRHACGYLPIQGLLSNTREHGLRIKAIDIRNSSQTVGNPDRVVGYGAFITEEVGTPTAVAEPPRQEEPTTPPPALYTTGMATPWTAIRESDHRQAVGPVLPQPLSQGEQALLVRAAMEAIVHELRSGQPLQLARTSKFSPALRQPAGSFVTLEKDRALRGCVGTIQATDPLIVSVARSAGNAAFRDMRFSPLTLKELSGLEIHLSILSQPRSLPFSGEEDLTRQLRPGIDGLILRAQGQSAVFLPSVWEQIPAPEKFVRRLKQKCGLDAYAEYPDLIAERFTTLVIKATLRDADSQPQN